MVRKRNDNNKLIIITMVVVSILIALITFEIGKISNDLNEDKNEAANQEETKKVTEKVYDTSNLTFTNIPLSTKGVLLRDICVNGCNINTQLNEENYKLIITRNTVTTEYKIDVVKDDKSLFEDKSLGTDITNASIFNYTNFLTLKTEIVNDTFTYDYALFINDTEYDEISSLNNKEMEFLESGVVYYYDVCAKEDSFNAKKVKAARIPFTETPVIISSSLANYTWCN